MFLPLLAALAIPQNPTTGAWYYFEWEDKSGKTRNYARPNATKINEKVPDSNLKSGDYWRFDPKMLGKMQKLVNLFTAAEPKPAYSHRMIHAGRGRKEVGGKIQDRFVLSFGDYIWRVENGVANPNKVEIGGYLPFNVGEFIVNGPANYFHALEVEPLFSFAEGLSFTSVFKKQLLPTGKIYRVPPVQRGYTIPELSKYVRLPISEGDATIDIQGAESVPYIFKKTIPQKTEAGPYCATTEYKFFWTTATKLPIDNFLTRGQMIKNFEIIAQTKLEDERKRLEENPLPTDEKKRAAELRYRERALDREKARIKLIEKFKSIFANSLGQIAIIPQLNRDGIEDGMFYAMLDEEFDAERGSKNPRKLLPEQLFTDDPKMGYRFGTPVPGYYDKLRPGEIRTLQFETKISHRFKSDPGYGKPNANLRPTFFADAPGNIRHALIYNFNWKAVKAVLGD